MQSDWDIIVIGGGAAGFFAAIHAAKGNKRVMILEKTTKLLSKVKVSGGGRCNVTHNCQDLNRLIEYYPRGGKSLKKPFSLFGPMDLMQWFERRGVKLKTEADGRVFPISDSSQTIIDCLLKEAQKKNVTIKLKMEVISLEVEKENFVLKCKNEKNISSKKVIICNGGHYKPESYAWLKELRLQVEDPIPSLFTFNVPNSDLKDLQGLSVKNAMIQIQGSKWKETGPVLITHWGFSAPAVIKLSARAAIELYKMNYQFNILINWCGMDEESVREYLLSYKSDHPKKILKGNPLFDVPARLWQRLCEKAGITSAQQYMDLPKKEMNRLIETLIRCRFQVSGKTTFKEEFVSCGGVKLSEVNLETFESRKFKGLYLAGEILNADGLTGGFNFQHAWTSGYLAGLDAQN